MAKLRHRKANQFAVDRPTAVAEPSFEPREFIVAIGVCSVPLQQADKALE